MKIKNKMEAFYRPAVSPFQLPPLSTTTIYPLFQRPPSKKIVLEKLAHIIETIVVESLTLSLKIIIIESSHPPLFRRQKKFGDFLPQNWQLFSL